MEIFEFFYFIDLFQVKAELDRVKQALQQLKEVEIKTAKHARINKDAAERFVTSGLWKPGEAKLKGKKKLKNSNDQEEENPTSKKARK